MTAAELLRERTAPELLYLETKFTALMSYGVTVDVLGEILPIGSQLNATTVQRHLLRVAERVEQELGEEQTIFTTKSKRIRSLAIFATVPS
jgi:hypothetical protein